METRLERNERRKKKRMKKKIKFIILCCFFLLFIFSMDIVNDTIKELDCLENTTILEINIESKSMGLFGKTYNIDFNKLKKLLEDRFSGLFVLHKWFYLL